MGSCIFVRNSILMASSLARMRFLIVLRPMTNEPHLRDLVQKWVNPTKSNVSGFPSSSFSPCLTAWRPKRVNSSKADKDDATLIDKVELAPA